MLDQLRARRIEIKYALITLVVLMGTGWLASHDMFQGIEGSVTSAMDRLASWGALGMFVIGIFSNMTLVIIVPYNLPMFTLVIYADSVWHAMAIGAATGLGGGIGEVTSYAVAHTIVRQVSDLEKSGLFRWTKRTIEKRPGLIPLFVWLASATPVPDASIIVPLAMVNYPWQKMILPMITGKIVQNVAVALIFRLAANNASSIVSRDINFDLTAILVMLFVIVIGYQIERARAAVKNNNSPAASQQDTQEMRAM